MNEQTFTLNIFFVCTLPDGHILEITTHHYTWDFLLSPGQREDLMRVLCLSVLLAVSQPRIWVGWRVDTETSDMLGLRFHDHMISTENNPNMSGTFISRVSHFSCCFQESPNVLFGDIWKTLGKFGETKSHQPPGAGWMTSVQIE